MRRKGIGRLFYPSSSAVYGSRKGLLSEDSGPLQPVSYYGACKLASESLNSAYSHMCDIDALVFRMPNVIGPGLTHGVIFDLIMKLKADPERLEILGDGNQRKEYLHVDDLVDGIMAFSNGNRGGMEVFNVSSDSSIDVGSIADLVCERMGVSPRYEYTGGEIGWKGDVSSFRFDISKARHPDFSNVQVKLKIASFF